MDCHHVAGKTYLCYMKGLVLMIFSLVLSGKAVAQFNTIGNTSSVHKAKPVDNMSKPDSMAMLPESRSSGNMDEVNAKRQELIKRYLSVAYPLKHIKVTSGYGSRMHPVMNKRMMHHGIDLRAKYEEVYSVMDGEVIAVSSDRRSGRYVTVRTPGLYTCSYCHLSQPMVKKGDLVKAGDVIAISGNTGISTGAHLHLGVRDDTENFINPLVLLDYIRKVRNEVICKLRTLQ